MDSGNKTEFKKWLRQIYQNYTFQRHEVEFDKRRKGFSIKVLKELLRNLRLLRNNYKGISDKVFDSILKIALNYKISPYKDFSDTIFLKLTTQNPKSNYYICFSLRYSDELSFYIDYFYNRYISDSICINFNENLLRFLY